MNSNSKDAETTYAPFLEDLEELICRFTIDRKINYINACLAGYFGIIPSAALGKDLSSFISQEALKALNFVLETLNPQVPALEYEHNSNSARRHIWQLWKIRGRFSRDGRLEEIQAVGRNISSQKKYQDLIDNYKDKLEQELSERTMELLKVNKHLQEEIEQRQQMELYYKDLFENASEIIYVHDMNGRPLTVNKAFMDFCGISSLQQIQKISIFDRLLPEYRETARQMLKDKIIKNHTTTYEVEIISGDGQIFPMEISTRLIIKDGQPVAVQGIARDLTWRRQSEKALKESEAKFRMLTEMAPGFIFVLQDTRFRYTNPTFEALLGYSAREMKELAISDIVHPDYSQLVFENSLARQNGELVPKRYDIKVVNKSGQVLWIDMIVELIKYEDKHAIIGMGQDITAARELQEAWIKSETTFRQLTDTAPALIFIIQQYRYRYVNSYFKEFTGFTDELLEGLHSLNPVHPEYRVRVKENLKTLQLAGEGYYREDIIILLSNGEERWIDFSASSFHWNGKPAVIAIAYDITEKKKLQADLVQSEINFRSLADTAPALIYVLKGSSLVYVNKAFEDITGYRRDECLHMSAWEFIHPGNRDWVKTTALARQKGQNVPRRYQTPMIHKDGHEYWAEFSVNKIEFDGEPAVLGVAIDITEQKKLQGALVQSEANFRSLADTAPALIYVLKGNSLVYVNKAFEDITGYRREECLHMSAWEFIHPCNRDWVKTTSLARQRGEDVPRRYQTPMIHKDGHEYWAEFSVNEIEFDGEPAVLGVAIDITEQKKAQDQIAYLSFHDKLTGLYNRAYLESRQIELDAKRYMPLSLIIGDVNGLKMVNDAFGHKTGDYLLQTVANILISSCEENDFIARWGGDEFVILLPQSDAQRAQKICDQIREACALITSFPVQVSISLGHATKTSANIVIEEIYKEAEDLMYRNKMLESRSNRSAFLTSLEKTLWVRSHETQEHTLRLRSLAVKIGQSLNLPSDELNNLTLLAALHDIGKIAIPNSILDKPSKLNMDEWELMKRHPEIGYRIALSCPELSSIADAILAHHERWDGKGYPLGMRENKIPLLSRILSLADAFDVMTTGRPYQAGISMEAALEEIDACAGTQFDPHLAQLFIDLVQGS